VISQCIQLLVSDLEGSCESALVAMAKVRSYRFLIFFLNIEFLSSNWYYFIGRLRGKHGRVLAISRSTWL